MVIRTIVGWFKTTVGEVATLQRGIDITRKEQRPGSVPVVSSGGVSSYHDTSASQGPGVILGRKGVVGSVYYIPTDYWPHDTTLWVKDFHGNHRRFVYYFFKNMAPRIASMDVGSANPTLNRNHVHPIPTILPPLGEQEAIAHILGTLDDKIELNRRMNETLEALALAIFKSWFVDFDPVIDNALKAGSPIPDEFADRASQRKEALARNKRDDAKFPTLDPKTAALFPDTFTDSLLGPIPRGWKAATLGEAVEILDSKRIPLSGRERANRQGAYPYHGAAGILDHVDDYLFDGVHVLMGEDGSVVNEANHPFVQYVWGQFWVNNHAHVLRGVNGVSNEQLLLFLQQVNVRPYVTGAVQPKLNQRNMKAIPFVQSTEPICRKFARIVNPLYGMRRSNAEESRTLASIRDTLLPKLLSGEIRVKDAERIAEEVA